MCAEDISPNIRGTEREIECPFVSPRVICASCDSPNFSIDSQAQSRRSVVTGRCDDCGGIRGKRISPKSPHR